MLNKKTIDLALDFYKSGKTAQEIANFLGISRCSVYKYINAKGVELHYPKYSVDRKAKKEQAEPIKEVEAVKEEETIKEYPVSAEQIHLPVGDERNAILEKFFETVMDMVVDVCDKLGV